MRKFSVSEFAKEVNDKLGNVNYFRKVLRNARVIRDKEPLTDDLIDVFKRAQYRHENSHCTWKEAFQEAVSQI